MYKVDLRVAAGMGFDAHCSLCGSHLVSFADPTDGSADYDGMYATSYIFLADHNKAACDWTPVPPAAWAPTTGPRPKDKVRRRRRPHLGRGAYLRGKK